MGRTQTYRLTGVERSFVSGESATLVGEDSTGTMAEAEVRKGVVVTTPTPPHQDGQRRVAVRTGIGGDTPRMLVHVGNHMRVATKYTGTK